MTEHHGTQETSELEMMHTVILSLASQLRVLVDLLPDEHPTFGNMSEVKRSSRELASSALALLRT